MKGKFIAKQAYLKKQEKFQPTSKRITKERTKPKVSRKKELIKIKSETETKKKKISIRQELAFAKEN